MSGARGSLAAWCGSRVFCVQRLETPLGTSTLEVPFTLRRVEEGRLMAAVGHEVQLVPAAVSEELLTDGFARFVEHLGPKVRRETRLWRLVFPGSTRELEQATHLVFRDTSLAPVIQRARLLGSRTRLRSSAPVVVWKGDTLLETLGLWRACALASAAKMKDVWLASLPVSVSSAPPQMLAEAVSTLRRLSAAELRQGARSWDAFVEGRPSLLEREAALAATQPRRAGRRVRLSELDVSLLSAFDTWKTPFEVLRSDSERWKLALEVLGDAVPSRLEQWARGPLLERAPRDAKSPWARAALRLTDAGRRALRDGVTDDALVPLRLGGFGRSEPQRTRGPRRS
ncbi:MAG: hypothetical protein ACOZQL_37940 [Myxococcota bacterium]